MQTPCLTNSKDQRPAMCHLLTMPSLTLIQTEAQRLARRIPERRRRPLQVALAELCETRWRELQGPQPESLLAQALWEVTPALSDLFVDLYIAGDARLDEVLDGYSPAQGLALLVLAGVERGDEAGVHIALEAMMAFETEPPPLPWLARIAALLRNTLEMPGLHHHDTHPPLWKALYVIALRIKRVDPPAVLQVIRLLIDNVGPFAANRDEALEKLRVDVTETGIHFLAIVDDLVHLEQHGHEHKPVRTRPLAEMLLEIRQLWLG